MRIRSLAIMMAVVLTASSVFAGTVSLIPNVVARYDAGFSPLPFTSPGSGPITDGAGIYEIEMSIHSFPTAGERGFASLSFDTSFAPGMGVALDYSPDSSTVDSNGTLPGGVIAKWSTNTDAGVPSDYQGMLLAASATLSATCGGANCPDPRGTLGAPDPEYFGTMYVNVGEDGGPLGFVNYQFSMRSSTTGLFLPPQQGFVEPILFDFVDPNTPPSIISPPAVGGVSQGDQLLGDFDATDTETPGGPFTFSNLQLASFDPDYPLWPIPNPDFLSNASLDPVTGEVTWDTTGFRRGLYDITVDVAEAGVDGLPGANNPGHWSVRITHVPEPSTLALFGLALVGCCGLGRRRS